MICPKCGFKNPAGTDFCRKCGEKSHDRHQFKSEKNRLMVLFMLITIITGFFGAASAQPIYASSSNVQNATVIVEQGFSGIVTIKDPIFNVTSNVTVNYQPYSYGSGFIVNQNGYIITAFHVLSDSKTLESKNEIKNMNSSDIQWYVEEAGLMEYLHSKNPILAYVLFKNVPKTQYDRRKALENATDEFIKKGQISTSSYKSEIYVNGSALNSTGGQDHLNATLVGYGNTVNGDDIALLKVDTSNTSAAAVSLNHQMNEKVTVYGYPINKNRSTPSSSSGNLKGMAPNPQGTIYFVTDAFTGEGYSGGPVVNRQDKVIGVLTYGIFDEKSKKVIGSLFLSSSYIQEICKKYNIPVTL